jgi:hypothetical protein
VLFSSHDGCKILLNNFAVILLFIVDFFCRKVCYFYVLCVLKTVSVIFNWVLSKKKKLIGDGYKKFRVGHGIQTACNVIVVFHLTILSENQHLSRTTKGPHKLQKIINRTVCILEGVMY